METITNKNRPFISIIIPVYNIGKYLDACICSILNSTYRDYEIILVDDGSTDSSPQICDKYKLLDHRIVVLHTANCGVSHARNEGIKIAKGEWVTFVDGDDIITDDMLDYLSKNAVNDIDLLQWGYKVLNGDTITKTIITESRIFSNHYEFIISENYQHSVWSYAFKREIIANNCIIFPPELRYAEDQVFILTYLFYTKKIKSLGISPYLYRKRVGSAVSCGFSHERAKTNLKAVLSFITIAQSRKKNNDIIIKVVVRQFIADYYLYLTYADDYSPKISFDVYRDFYIQYKNIVCKNNRDWFLRIPLIHPRMGMFVFTKPNIWRR